MLVRRLLIGSAVLAGTVTLAACGSEGGDTKPTSPASAPATTSAAAPAPVPVTGGAPWPAPTDASARAKVAGLPMLGAEGQVLHIHSHVDVLVNGRSLVVPADIGIDLEQQKISPLHTHDTTGIVHIESPVQADFTLGQFMTEWNVQLTKDRLGPLKTGGGKELHVYVNGKEQSGDPAAVKLTAHAEIAIVYGKPGTEVPSAYAFPAGV